MGIMGAVRRWASRRQMKMNSLELFREIYGGRESSAGVTVNWHTAIEVATVQACVRSIANGVCQVPLKVYQEQGGNRLVVRDHWLYELLSVAPNRWQTAFEFLETVMVHALLANNAYVFVNRVGSARKIVELVPIEPQRVTVKQNDDLSLIYQVTSEKGGQRDFPQESIWHIRGMSWNGWLGMDAVRLARDAIGLSISLEDGQAAFQRGGARTSGLLSVEGTLSPERYAFLAAWLDKYLPGGERFQKPMLVDNGAKYMPFTMSGVDQQLIETRKHQIEEICRAFGVMPIMVGHADKTATYASAEQMFLAHVVHTLSPWYERLQKSIAANLLSPEDRAAGYYVKFLPNGLMRGASKDRAEFYSRALGSGNVKGWMTQNEVRAAEDLPLSDDPEADRLPQPPGISDSNATPGAGDGEDE